jgi:hypothetical protein
MNNWIYKKTNDNTSRFILGERGDNNLICIGVNPSTATPELLDNTLKTVKTMAQKMGFDGWIMMNLYPQRATNPNDMPTEINQDLHLQNLRHFQDVFTFGHTTVWAAWGALVEKRSYLPDCMKDIVDLANRYSVNWHKIGELTKAGHPRHPLYLKHSLPLETFDMNSYLNIQVQNFGQRKDVAQPTLLEIKMNKAPWTDYNGQDINEGDTIQHPSGERGRVVFLVNEKDPGDQWRVDYGDGSLSRLCLQIGDKGQAIVTPN